MEALTDTHLTVQQLAAHWGVCDKTVYNLISSGILPAEKFAQYWIAWPDIWAHEQGPIPRPELQPRYRTNLLSRNCLAELTHTSLRTVDRWLARGLTTRNVRGSVRVNAADAIDWLSRDDRNTIPVRLLRAYLRDQSGTG